MERNNAPPANAAQDKKLERQSSMEEPKTLREAELSAYGEAALMVLRTRTPEEATRIFLGKSEVVALSKLNLTRQSIRDGRPIEEVVTQINSA